MKQILLMLFAISLFWACVDVVSLLPACPPATRAATQTTSQDILLAAEKAPDSQAAAPQDVFILRDSPLGVVKFEHRLHQERAANKCEICHHVSREEKPTKSAQQSCFDCHTKPPQPGMKTGRQAAFHNPMAQAGTCIDCHTRQNALGKKAPTRCMDCHKRENT